LSSRSKHLAISEGSINMNSKMTQCKSESQKENVNCARWIVVNCLTLSSSIRSDTFDQDHRIGIFTLADSFLQELGIRTDITTQMVHETRLREAASVEFDNLYGDHQQQPQ
jgi:hypothetical protein